MQNRTIEISVGALVLSFILTMAFLAIQVSGISIHDTGRNSYSVYAHFSNISGLGERAKVTLAGVVIGRVTAISLDPLDNRAKVQMAIHKEVNFITADSIASIQTAGVLGEKYIAIIQGGAPELLAEGSNITDTQSALILEDLIGKLITSLSAKKE
jgi:phospholipid/cholesterol/gamma-HCH transport system substrate-binding protein